MITTGKRRALILAKQVSHDCGKPVLHNTELPSELVRDCRKFLLMMDAYERLKNKRGTGEVGL